MFILPTVSRRTPEDVDGEGNTGPSGNVSCFCFFNYPSVRRKTC